MRARYLPPHAQAHSLPPSDFFIKTPKSILTRSFGTLLPAILETSAMAPKKNHNKKEEAEEEVRSEKAGKRQFADCSSARQFALATSGGLREQIYDFLFVSTRVTFGQRSTGRIRRKTLKPAPHSLALLRVCRQIYKEGKSFWLGRVLFNFENVEIFLTSFPNYLSLHSPNPPYSYSWPYADAHPARLG